MDQTAITPPVWVARPNVLAKMIAHLSQAAQIAIDTESNSLYAYHEQVCLIQLSIPHTDYLIDPLALTDLSSLAPLMASPTIEKIFHAAEYDIICLKRDFGFEFEHIFDTMQASRILGRKDVGLGNVLKNEFGLELEKRFQRANWGQRPLTPAMLAYARLDSHYLIDLRNHLAAELAERGLLDLAEEDFLRLAHLKAAPREAQPAAWYRLTNGHELTQRQCTVLQALLDYRDSQAREINVPPFKIINNQTLIDLAKACPTRPEELEETSLLSERQLHLHAHGILEAVSRSSTLQLPQRPANHRPNEAVLNRIDLLKSWRKTTAQKLEVESDVVLPKDLLETIAFCGPKSLSDLHDVMNEFPWRYQRFGEQILDTIHKQE